MCHGIYMYYISNYIPYSKHSNSCHRWLLVMAKWKVLAKEQPQIATNFLDNKIAKVSKHSETYICSIFTETRGLSNPLIPTAIQKLSRGRAIALGSDKSQFLTWRVPCYPHTFERSIAFELTLQLRFRTARAKVSYIHSR